MPVDSTDSEASVSGISPLVEIRKALIILRDNLLKLGQWDNAVLLTHAIWWLAPAEKEKQNASSS